jgi:hypothetical protein
LAGKLLEACAEEIYGQVEIETSNDKIKLAFGLSVSRTLSDDTNKTTNE